MSQSNQQSFSTDINAQERAKLAAMRIAVEVHRCRKGLLSPDPFYRVQCMAQLMQISLGFVVILSRTVKRIQKRPATGTLRDYQYITAAWLH